MKLTPRVRMLVGFLLANLAIVAVAAAVVLNRPATPPLIQGVFLPQSRDLAPFSLLDHRNQPFTNQQLRGQWHLVSYGFTSCPDICPTTLAQLAEVAKVLQLEGDDLRFLFYTVDHRRDTVTQLANYLPFFHPAFIGLTHLDDSANPHLAFEQGLGIMAKLTSSDTLVEGRYTSDYQVSHGVTLFLLNPAGQLQAIFEPGEDQHGNKVFDPKTIYRDYLAIRDYRG